MSRSENSTSEPTASDASLAVAASVDGESAPTSVTSSTPRQRPSFRLVLILVILPQVALAVVVTGWLARVSAERSIEDVALLLRQDYTERIQEQLTDFFGLAPIVTQLNQESVNIGVTDLADLDTLTLQFWKQLVVLESLGWVAFGAETGDYLGVQRLGELEVDRFRGSDLVTYRLLDDGTRGQQLRVTQNYDPRNRPWYRSAVEADGLVWTAPYDWQGLDILCVDAVAPVRGPDGALVGVLDAGFSLAGISEYLGSLSIGGSGRTFIIEPNGLLVASSFGPVLASTPEGELARLSPVDSDDPVVRAVGEQLTSRIPELSALSNPLQDIEFEFEFEGNRQFVQVAPAAPGVGLDWLVVVAVTDADFRTHTDANRRDMRLITACSLAVALLLGLLLIRWLSKPLVDLAERARRIQGGDLEVEFVPQSRDEIGYLTQTMGEMVNGLKERERIRDAFGRYVSNDIVQELLSRPGALEPGGQLTQATVLMSDLRGFSILTESLGPTEMVRLLNTYLSCMIGVIHLYDGMINDFIGDAILVLFGPPQSRDDDSERAVRCAIAMQLALNQFNNENLGGDLDLSMGVGIDTGPVIVGNLGSTERVKYGVIGESVNMAARIESLTVGGQILISQTTQGLVPDVFDMGSPLAIKVKGRADALVLYDIRGALDSPELKLESVVDSPMRVVDLQADLWVLSGKSVVDRSERVRVRRLGARGLEMTTRGRWLRPLENVKIRLRDWDGEPLAWYAKVQEATPSATERAAQTCTLAFTSEAEKTLEERLRERLSHALTDESDSAPARADFVSQLADAPIKNARDRDTTTRILVEIAFADNILRESERAFISQFMSTELPLEALMNRPKLTTANLASTSPGKVRETMLMLAWATALCDAELAEEELTLLAEVADGLGISDQRAFELRGAAQIFLADAAFSSIWPEQDSLGTDQLAGSVHDLSQAYAEMIENWLPVYGDLLRAAVANLPEDQTAKRVVEIGAGHGHLAHHLVARYPHTQLSLFEPVPSLLERCQRRFAGIEHVRCELVALGDIELATASVDVIVLSLTSPRIDTGDLPRLLRQVMKWLAPAGVLIWADAFFASVEPVRAQHWESWQQAASILGVPVDNDRSSGVSLNAAIAGLKTAGFVSMDCTWRQDLWAVVAATPPDETITTEG